MKALHARRPQPRGFTLLEVLISIVVVSFGLLGVAKMQALAISRTQISSTRSLMAMQVSSLASAMHGDKAYWAVGTAPSFTIANDGNGGTVTDATGNLSSTSTDCVSAVCTPAAQAAYDLNAWKTNLLSQFKAVQGVSVTFSNVVGTPVSCVITVTWSEKDVAMNKSTAAAAQPVPQSYSLYVEP